MTEVSTTSARAANPSSFHARGGRRKRVCILLTALCIPAVAIPILALRGGVSTATAVPLVDKIAADPASPRAIEATRAVPTLQGRGQSYATKMDAQSLDAEARAFRGPPPNDGTRIADPDKP